MLICVMYNNTTHSKRKEKELKRNEEEEIKRNESDFKATTQ